MKTLSVKQPWAYLICSGIKDIENRTWRTSYRGRVLIHASAKCTMDIRMFLNMTSQQMDQVYKIADSLGQNFEAIKCGAIIGSVEIVDCVVNHPSVWAEKSEKGQCDITGKWIKPIYNWVLANPILFDEPILNIKGKLGFWDYEFSEDLAMHLVCGTENKYHTYTKYNIV